MNACVTDAAGERWALPRPTAWRLEYTAGVPCDSFWLRCPWDGGNTTKPADWVEFSAEQGGARVFTGVVDECEVSLSRRGRLLEVSGRGMEGHYPGPRAALRHHGGPGGPAAGGGPVLGGHGEQRVVGGV